MQYSHFNPRHNHFDSSSPAESDSNEFVRIAWVRRIGTDAASSLPIHLHSSHDSVADILIAAHKLLFSSRDAVAASDLECVTPKGVPVSNLDSIEMLATLHRMEQNNMLKQQTTSSATAAASAPSPAATGARAPVNITTPGKMAAAGWSDNNNNNRMQGPVDVFLLLRRRQRPIGSSLLQGIDSPVSGGRGGKILGGGGGGDSPAQLFDAVVRDLTSTRNSRAGNNNSKSYSNQQTNGKNRATTPSSRAKTPPASNTASRALRAVASSAKKPFQGNAAATTSSATFSSPTTAAGHSSASAEGDSSAETGETPQQGDNNNNTNISDAFVTDNRTGQRSPIRKAQPVACDNFAARFGLVNGEVCEHCHRPRRLHAAHATKQWDDKLQAQMRNVSPERHRMFTAMMARDRKTGPLHRPRNVTPKAFAGSSPVTCKQFEACWKRENFCKVCNGARDHHTREALHEHQRQKDILNHSIKSPHSDSDNNNHNSIWQSSRPLPAASFEERRQWRSEAAAKKCAAFTPLWNHNSYCALCFCHIDQHPAEKLYFVSPPALPADYLVGVASGGGVGGGRGGNTTIRGQRPDFLVSSGAVHSSRAGQSAARNWWLVNFPWRYTVVFLALEDLLSMAQASRWLCVAVRPLLRSTVTALESGGVTAHVQLLKNDAVRLASHFESCGREIKLLVAAALGALFHLPRSNKNNDNSRSSPSPASGEKKDSSAALSSSTLSFAANALDYEQVSAILVGGTVGSRSALFRRLSRIPLEGTVPDKAELDRALHHLEIALASASFSSSSSSSSSSSTRAGGSGRAAQKEASSSPPSARAASTERSSSQEEAKNGQAAFETEHAKVVAREMFAMIKLAAFQCVTLKRARRYLAQDYEPL